MKIGFSNRYRLLSVCLLMLVLTPVFGVELELTALTGMQASDNITLSNDGGEQDVRQTVGFDLGISEAGKYIQADINLSAEHSKYYQERYSDQTSLGAGVGVLSVGLIESFLDWRTSFTRTETITDSNNRSDPDNREYRNVVRSGPVLSYQFSRATEVELSSSYVGVENSDPDVSDSERVENSLGLFYSINPLTQINLNGNYARVIDGDELDTFENANVNLGFVRRLSKGRLAINIGKTRFIPETGEYREGDFVDVQFNHERLFLHDWSLRFNENISDTSIGFDNEEDALAADSREATRINGTDILERRQFSLRVQREVGRLFYEVSSLWENEDYLVQLNDQRAQTVNAQVRRRVSPSLTVGAAYSWQADEFIDTPSLGTDRTASYEANSTYLFSQEVSLVSYLRYENRRNGVNKNREYEGVFIGLDLSWRLF